MTDLLHSVDREEANFHSHRKGQLVLLPSRLCPEKPSIDLKSQPGYLPLGKI